MSLSDRHHVGQRRMLCCQVAFGDDSWHLFGGRIQNKKLCELEVMTLYGCCSIQVVHLFLRSSCFKSCRKKEARQRYSMNALPELQVYVAMTPEMATRLATHGNVAPTYKGRWGLRPTREEARRQGAEKSANVVDRFFCACVDCFVSTDGAKRRSSGLWILTEQTMPRTSARWMCTRWSLFQ